MLDMFYKYVSNYEMDNDKIKLKYDHSIRVMELSSEYAKKLGWNNEDIFIAKIIGLLHDLGRFEQFKVYGTFDDVVSIDHANYSVEQLFDKGEIKKFVATREYDDIIRLAIKNHNKKMIQGVTDDRTMKFCKLIRDIDKLDIYYNMACLGEISCYTEPVCISDAVLKNIKDNETVDIKNRKVRNDFVATNLAFVFDIYNDDLLPKIKEYIDIIYQKLEHKIYFEEVYQEINKYLEKRMK